METQVRSARREDLPALTGLLGQLFEQEAEFHPDPETNLRGLAMILAAPEQGSIVVVERDGMIRGMIVTLYTISTALGAKVGLLEDVVIDKACRGESLGKKLLAFALETARAHGCQRMTLLTDPENLKAHKLYRDFGFTRSAMVPFRLAMAQTRDA
jgi:ribosomal protein S18 acetylase RimI-like enzyme